MRKITLTLSALALVAGVSSAYAVDDSGTTDTNGASKSTASDANSMKRSHIERRDMSRREAMMNRDMKDGQNSPVTNNENRTTMGYNAPGYAGYGNSGESFDRPGYVDGGPDYDAPAQYGYGAPDVAPGYDGPIVGDNNPVTNNENWSTQGNNAPGYAGYGNPGSGPIGGPVANPDYAYRGYGYDGDLQEGRAAAIVGPMAASSPVKHRETFEPSVLSGPKGR